MTTDIPKKLKDSLLALEKSAMVGLVNAIVSGENDLPATEVAHKYGKYPIGF